MGFKDIDDFPINWPDHEDVAMKLYDKFGDDFSEQKASKLAMDRLKIPIQATS